MRSVFCLLAILGALLHASAQAEDTIPVSRNQIVKVTDTGVVPRELHMKKDDTFVFFFNQTTDSLATFELDFGKHRSHCASPNMQIDDNGVARSKRPFGPKSFAVLCFPEVGRYPVKVYGLSHRQGPENATIIVE